jgi:hypothetical protein
MTPKALDRALAKVAAGHARVATQAHPHCMCWGGAGRALLLDYAGRVPREWPPCYLHDRLRGAQGVVRLLPGTPSLEDVWRETLARNDSRE